MASSPYVSVLVLSDTAGRIRYGNDGAGRLFGYAAVEAEGQSLDLIVPREYCERHWAGFRKTTRTSECKLDRAAINLPLMGKDGTVRVFPALFVFLQRLATNWVLHWASIPPLRGHHLSDPRSIPAAN